MTNYTSNDCTQCNDFDHGAAMASAQIAHDELYDKLHERISKLEDELDELHLEEAATENALSTWDYIDTRLSECSSDRVRTRFLGMLDGGEEDAGYFVSEYGSRLAALREQIKLKQSEFQAIEAQIKQLRSISGDMPNVGDIMPNISGETTYIRGNVSGFRGDVCVIYGKISDGNEQKYLYYRSNQQLRTK